RHEITRHFRICYGNWSTTFNLFFKQWNHTATTPEYVPETDSDKLRLALTCQVLHNHLCDTFRCTHYVCWVNSFIRRYHDKCLDTKSGCCFGDVFRSYHI